MKKRGRGVDALFKLSFRLFLLSAGGMWHRDVGGAVEDVSAV